MLQDALARLPGIEIAGVADSCHSALELVARHQPAAITLDLTLKDGSSVPRISSFAATRPGLKIIVFSLSVEPVIRQKVLTAGAAYCLDKNDGVQSVVDAVRVLQTESSPAPHI